MVMVLLRKHWFFLVAVVASLGLLGFGHSEVAPIGEEVERLQNEAVSAETRFVSSVSQDSTDFGQPANHALADQRARLAKLEEVVSSLARQVGYEVAPHHVMPAGLEDLDERNFAANQKRKLESWLNRYIPRRWGPRMTIEDMGYDFTKSEGEGRITNDAKLRRLDLLERVARQAIDSGITKVTHFRFVANTELPESVRQRVPSTQRTIAARGPAALLPPIGRDQPQDAEQAPQSSPLLRGIVMQVQFRGSWTEIESFLLGLQQSRSGNLDSRALAIEELELLKEDQANEQDGTLIGKATLIAYEVNLGAELPLQSQLQALKRVFPDQDFEAAATPGAAPRRVGFR